MKHCLLWALLAVSAFLVNADTDPNYRLNTPVYPSTYTIRLAPYLDTNDDREFSYDGEVDIVLSTQEANVQQIKLHSEDLVYGSENITLTRAGANVPLDSNNPVTFDTQYTFVFINLAAPLDANVDYVLNIVYTGPIRNDLNGFYRSYYHENGVTKWLGATQMQPTHARKVFPCFDEPAYKAKFTMIIDRPERYTTVRANTKLASSTPLTTGYFRETFHPTPRMSTYLLAFLVSEFSGVDAADVNRPLGVWTRPEAINQTDFTVEIGVKIENGLSNYFSIDYYSKDANLKLDHVALPDFRAGAMENWGLLTYRESLLLYAPEDTSPYYKYRVAQIVAHESAHMWFGDLVTCHWWSDTWLNEGFANYFENFIVEKVAPELGAGDIMVTGAFQSALGVDDVSSSPALTNNNVNSPAEISGHFGTITYSKGGSILRMVHNLIGDNAFKNGLTSYLETNEFDMGTPSKMYEALEKGINLTYVFSDAYPGLTFTEVMSAWITTPGFPLLTVTVDHANKKITLEQSRFYGKASVEPTNEIYPIPITYTTENNAQFVDTKPVFIMNEKTYVIENANIENNNWVIFNLQSYAFMRVNYDTNTWRQIARALKAEGHSQIHYLNRAEIVNDLFTFLNRDILTFSLVSEVLEFLSQETDLSVWLTALNGFNSLRNKYMYDTEAVATLDKYITRLMSHAISQLGYEDKETDTFAQSRTRLLLLEFACKINHQECIDQSVLVFRQLRDNGVPVSPSLRPLIYCNGLRYGAAEEFEFLWDRMLKTNVANEAITMQTALGCTRDETSIKRYLRTVLEADTPVRSQDITLPLTSILGDHNNVEVALDFIKENYEALTQVYTSMESVLSYFPPAMHTEEQYAAFEAWVNSCTVCSQSVKDSALNSVNNARSTTEWAKDHESAIITHLTGAATVNAPSVAGLFVAFAMAFVHRN